MKNNTVFTVLFLFFVMISYCQEKSSITGKVSTSDAIPARQIKLVIDDFKIETQSDEKGIINLIMLRQKKELKSVYTLMV